jgi:hypothetical protein
VWHVMRKMWITFESGTQFLSRWFEENRDRNDNIPSMYGMNRILTDIGWAAWRGWFIQRFMEFQAYNVLVIASDIRHLEHIEYTPAQTLFMKVLVMPLLLPTQNMQNIYVVLEK